MVDAFVQNYYGECLCVTKEGPDTIRIGSGTAGWFDGPFLHKGYWLTEPLILSVPEGSSRVVVRINYEEQNVRAKVTQDFEEQDLFLAGIRCEDGEIVDLWDLRRFITASYGLAEGMIVRKGEL
jgi:hypothetical protein